MMTSIVRILQKREVAIAIVLVLCMLFIGFVNPAFWQPANLFSLVKSNIVIGILALGVMLIMLSGGIDVSAPTFAIAAMYLTIKGMNAIGYDGIWLPFVAATLIGLALGFVNAFFVHRLRINPLIVTLGTSGMVRGFLLGVVGTSMINVTELPKALIMFGRTDLVVIENSYGGSSGLTAMVLLYLAVAVGLFLVLRYTLIGRSVYAVGGDAEAAHRAGFNLRRTMLFVYGTAGALAGFAGLLHSSMSWLADPRDFMGLELEVIAAVVLGGASIFGGRGSVLGTMLGVFILVMIKNSLVIMHVDSTWQKVVIGLIIIVATAITAWRDRAARSRVSGLTGAST